MDIENVKVDWAPVLESQIASLEEKFPGRGIRVTFDSIIGDLNGNRIKSRLILSNKEPAGYAYYILPEGMTDRILGNAGFVEKDYATVSRAENLMGWLVDEAKSLGRFVMINDLFNGNEDTASVIDSMGFLKMERSMMEISLREVSEADPDIPPGYSIEGLNRLNTDEYLSVQISSYEGTEDEILFSTKKEEQVALSRSIFEGNYGRVITEVSRIARFNEKLAGACIVTAGKSESPIPGYPLIIDVFVGKEHRGRGIAKGLLLETLRRAKVANLNKLYLWVNAKNRAKDLYETVGFRDSSYPKEIIYYKQP